MAAVPSPAVPSVAPTGSTGLPYQSAAGASPDAFGAAVGQAEQGLGKEIGVVGDVLSKHALQMQEEVNASTAKDLFLQGDVAIGKLQVDYNSLEGANRVNAYPKYIEDIGKIRADLKAQAPNGDVARRFDQDFARRVGYSIVDGARSAATANKQYQKDTNAAVQQNAMSHIAANAQDDNRFQTELGIGLDTVKSSDDYKGASPEVQKQHEEAFASGAWATRLQSMAKTDPLRARELFQKNKGSIDGITQLKLDDQINQQIVNVQSRVDADKIIQSGAFVSPELVNKLKVFENAPLAAGKTGGTIGNPQWDYKQTSSGYGTKAQPGDENIPPEQKQAIYTQRLETEVGRAATIVDNFAPGLPSGTRDALISLTYNAGSAWTSLGLGKAIRAGDMETAKLKFLEYKYAGNQVNSTLEERRAQEASWWGGEPHEIDSVSHLGAALDKAKEQAIKVFPDDPAHQAKYLDTLQSRIKTDFNVLQGAARDMQLQIKNTVQAELVDPDHHVTSYDKLSPKAQAAYDSAPEPLQQVFNNAFKKNAMAPVPDTKERLDRFLTLRGELIQEPEKGMSRIYTNEDLTKSQMKTLSEMQQNKKALNEKGANLNSAMKTIEADLNDAQIWKSHTDSEKNAEYNKFSGVFQKALDDFYQEKKRAPNVKETTELGKSLLRDVVTSNNWIFSNSHDPAYRVIADKTPIANPAGTDEDAFQKHYDTIPKGATYVAPDGNPRVKR